MDKTELGDRMKSYEKIYTESKLIPQLPIYIRLDGRGFSKFTKGMERPYDVRMQEVMQETTAYLVKELNATVGYTQSDEISLLIPSGHIADHTLFKGKLQKICSISAALASVKFATMIAMHFPEKLEKRLPVFDSRVINLPNCDEAENMFLWREQDATKNSISMLAQHHFTHKELHKKNSSDMQDMLMLQKGINWNDEPAAFKRGSYIKKIPYVKKADVQEAAGNMKYAAKDTIRTRIGRVDAEPLLKMSSDERCTLFWEDSMRLAIDAFDEA